MSETSEALPCMYSCPHCEEIFADEDSFKHHVPTHKVKPTQTAPKKPPSVVQLLQIEPLTIELGVGLLNSFPERNAQLIERIEALRRHMALELGIVLPGVRIKDHPGLSSYDYQLKVRERYAGEGSLRADGFLAVGPPEKLAGLAGDAAIDPAYGMPGKWIRPDKRRDAELLGCMIFDPVSMLSIHFTEIIRRNAIEFIGWQETQCLLDTLQKTHPAVIKVWEGNKGDLNVLSQVLRNLLAELVSIRDLVKILETVVQCSGLTQDPEIITEFARVALAPQICENLINRQRTLNVMSLDFKLEVEIAASLDDGILQLAPESLAQILSALGEQIGQIQERGLASILVTTPQLRFPLRRVTARTYPDLVVLSWAEIPHNVKVYVLSTVGIGEM